MPRLIYADEFRKRIDHYPPDIRDIAKKELRYTPTIDAVEVVRCRECKHYQFANERAFGMPVKRCEITGFEDVDDEDFCSRGEEETDAGIHY